MTEKQNDLLPEIPGATLPGFASEVTETPPEPDKESSDKTKKQEPTQPDMSKKPKSSPAYTEQEAPIVLHTTRYLPDGGWVSFTMRGTDAIDLIDWFSVMMTYAEENHGWSGVKQNAQSPSINPPSPSYPFPPTDATSANQTPQPSSPRNDSSGTEVFNKMIITPDNKFEFYVGRFKWPFKDSRSPETVAQIFDTELHITPDMLRKPTKWEPQGLLADWVLVEKPKGDGTVAKYYNVVRIYKAPSGTPSSEFPPF